MKKFLTSSFVSRFGQHTPRSLGNDLNIPKLSKKLLTSNSASDKFNTAGKVLTTATQTLRFLSFVRQCHIGMADNGSSSITNTNHVSVPYYCETSANKLGPNDAVYYKTNTHIGRPLSSKIKKILTTASVEKLVKRTASSSEDYLTHKNRELLRFESGFNEKGFAFLMEDTYFSVSDYYDLFQIDKRFKKSFQSKDGSKDIFGCILKTKNNFKIKNHMQYYSLHLQIHLIKIMDLETDVRSLIQEITHNSKVSSIVNSDSGRIPKDFQYTKDPNFSDLTNKFKINFLTSLNCNLNQSSKFKERAKIVKSWSRTLPANSIWDFSLTTHTGKGIYLNRLFDIQNRLLERDQTNDQLNAAETVVTKLTNTANQTTVKTVKEAISELLSLNSKPKNKKSEHPVGYVFCIEYVGDRRGSLENSHGDIFNGYSPCEFRIEFFTDITFLAEDEDEDKLITWRRSKQEKNFQEDSIFNDIFYPERENAFHVNINDINIVGKKSKGKKKYNLVYDEGVKSRGDLSDIMNVFTKKLDEYGLNINNLSPDEFNLNFTKSENGEDYGGPDATAPSPPTEPTDN